MEEEWNHLVEHTNFCMSVQIQSDVRGESQSEESAGRNINQKKEKKKKKKIGERGNL